MSDLLTRARLAFEIASDRPLEMALLAALDPEDETLVELAAKTDFEFSSDAAIEPSLWKDADEDERYVARLYARAVILALRYSIRSPQADATTNNS